MRTTKNMNRRRKYRKRRNDPRCLLQTLWPQDSTSADRPAEPLTLLAVSRLVEELRYEPEKCVGRGPLTSGDWLRENPGFRIVLSAQDLQQLTDEANDRSGDSGGGPMTQFMGIPVQQNEAVPEGVILLIENVAQHELFFRKPRIARLVNAKTGEADGTT